MSQDEAFAKIISRLNGEPIDDAELSAIFKKYPDLAGILDGPLQGPFLYIEDLSEEQKSALAELAKIKKNVIKHTNNQNG